MSKTRKQIRNELVAAIDKRKADMESADEVRAKIDSLKDAIELSKKQKLSEYELTRKTLVEKYAHGDISDDVFSKEIKIAEDHRVGDVHDEELLEAMLKRQIQLSNDIAYSPIKKLQSEYREAVFNETFDLLRKKPGVVEAMRELVVLCDVTMVHEAMAIEDFISISADERIEQAEKVTDRELLQLRV